MKKQRRNLTLSVDSNAFLDSKENASAFVDALLLYARALRLPETPEALREAVVSVRSRRSS